jgi:hypothetical protein
MAKRFLEPLPSGHVAAMVAVEVMEELAGWVKMVRRAVTVELAGPEEVVNHMLHKVAVVMAVMAAVVVAEEMEEMEEMEETPVTSPYFIKPEARFPISHFKALMLWLEGMEEQKVTWAMEVAVVQAVEAGRVIPQVQAAIPAILVRMVQTENLGLKVLMGTFNTLQSNECCSGRVRSLPASPSRLFWQ